MDTNLIAGMLQGLVTITTLIPALVVAVVGLLFLADRTGR